MDPAKTPRSLIEALLREQEGSDDSDGQRPRPAIPRHHHRTCARKRSLPIAAYNVSGEYAMVEGAPSAAGSMSEPIAARTLLCLSGLGADSHLTYHAL